MAKKKHNDEFSVKDSMIFERSDRKKADEDGAAPKKPKKIGKIVRTVFIALGGLLVGVPLGIITVIDSPTESIHNNGLPKHTFEELLDATTPTEDAEKLFAMKNPDITDPSKLSEMLEFLQVRDELGDFELEVQNQAKPYSITLKFKLTHDVPSDGFDRWEHDMIKYSCAVMSMVNNIATVNWEYPSSAEADGTAGAYFTRADAEKYYNLGVTATQFARNSTSVQLMLNQLGIELY